MSKTNNDFEYLENVKMGNEVGTKAGLLERPFRVRKIRRNGARGMHGWSDSVKRYATMDEAVAQMKALMKGGVYEVQVSVYDETCWRPLATRKINKDPVFNQ